MSANETNTLDSHGDCKYDKKRKTMKSLWADEEKQQNEADNDVDGPIIEIPRSNTIIPKKNMKRTNNSASLLLRKRVQLENYKLRRESEMKRIRPNCQHQELQDDLQGGGGRRRRQGHHQFWTMNNTTERALMMRFRQDDADQQRYYIRPLSMNARRSSSMEHYYLFSIRDVRVEIWSFLRVKDIGNIASSCQQWQKDVRSDDVFWKALIEQTLPGSLPPVVTSNFWSFYKSWTMTSSSSSSSMNNRPCFIVKTSSSAAVSSVKKPDRYHAIVEFPQMMEEATDGNRNPIRRTFPFDPSMITGDSHPQYTSSLDEQQQQQQQSCSCNWQQETILSTEMQPYSFLRLPLHSTKVVPFPKHEELDRFHFHIRLLRESDNRIVCLMSSSTIINNNKLPRATMVKTNATDYVYNKERNVWEGWSWFRRLLTIVDVKKDDDVFPSDPSTKDEMMVAADQVALSADAKIIFEEEDNNNDERFLHLTLNELLIGLSVDKRNRKGMICCCRMTHLWSNRLK